MKKRDEIEERYKWDLSGYQKDIKSAMDEFKQLVKVAETICQYENKLSSDEILFECLEKNRCLDEKFEIVSNYVSLRQKEDSNNSEATEALGIMSAIYGDLSVKLAFINTEISSFSIEKLDGLIANARFAEYKEMFEETKRLKKHKLSKSQEKLLARVGEFAGGSSEVFDMFDSSEVVFDDALDSAGKNHELNNANYSVLVKSEDRILRQNAYKNLQAGYGKLNKTIAANYINSVVVDCCYAKIRKFKSCLESALFYEEIPKEVYLKLIEKTNAFLPEFYGYFDIKKKMLGLGKFQISDAYAENPNVPKMKFTFEEAFDLVKRALSPLGEEYQKLLDVAQYDRWVDAMPNVGKDTGAFSSGAYRKNPVILMNFAGDLNSVFTLAHELGHSMHSYFAEQNQNILNADYPIFIAEIASTTNEMLLLNYLLKNAKSDDEKVFYIDTFLSMARATIFRQTMFAEFEEIVHKKYENKEPLSAEVLNGLYIDLNKKYFGPNVEIFDETKFEWSRIPHFYNSFYVYKYATGLISAIAISENILTDKNYYKTYLRMLCSGGRLSPMKTLEICGVDLTKNKPFDLAFSKIKQSIQDLKSLIK